MTWYDVDDILYDGSEEEIRACRCPDCGAELRFHYAAEAKTLEVKCTGCGMAARHHCGEQRPNCAALSEVKTA